MSEEQESDSGGTGCFVMAIAIMALWALLFGVTIDGKHYGVSGCDCNGLHVDRGAPTK